MKTLYESILSSTNSGKYAYYINVIKNNLELCNDIKEFSKAWSALGFDINGFHWGQYAGRNSYTYFDDNLKHCMIYCTKDMIAIYNDEPELWYCDKEFKDYCNKVSNMLKMKKHINKTQKGNQCILKF